MLSRLKNVFPIRNIVRIVDFHFASLERLHESTRATRETLDRMAGSAVRNEIAILDGLSEVVSALAEIKAQTAGAATREALESARHSLASNDTAILNTLAEMRAEVAEVASRAALENATRSLAASDASILNVLSEMSSTLAEIKAGVGPNPIVIDVAGGHDAQDREIALLEYLFSYLPTRNAIDVGANVGAFSERLLETGYEIHAFEPFAPSFEELQARLGARPGFQASQCAIGAEDGVSELHIAANTTSAASGPDPRLFNSLVDHPLTEDLAWVATAPVQVRSLASLRCKGEIPEDASLLKIDTEGFDLQVVRGMGASTYSVVMTDFWDAEHPLGRPGVGRLADLAGEMRCRGYLWYIVIYHAYPSDAVVSFYCNQVRTIPRSWGNVLFFREHPLFAHALDWCNATMPRTLFR